MPFSPMHILLLVSSCYKDYTMPHYCETIHKVQWEPKYWFQFNRMDGEAIFVHELETLGLEPWKSKVSNGGLVIFAAKQVCPN